MNGVVGLAVIGFIAWCLCSKGSGTKRAAYPIAKHHTGWSMSHVRRHERGHYRVARALGCSAKVDLNRGATYVEDDHCTPTEKAAISYGGWAAAGSNGCQHDFNDVDQYLRQVPWSQRGAARSEAKRIARKYA